MIKPLELDSDRPHGPWSCRACDVWDVLCAAEAGDVAALSRLLQRDVNLHRAEYWYTQPIQLAVREGRVEAVRLLLDAGADPSRVALNGENLVTTARDRGHEDVVHVLEDARAVRDRVRPADRSVTDHAIHSAAARDDVAALRELLDADPALVHRRDGQGATPLHRGAKAGARMALEALLDRGADIHALHGAGPANESGYAPLDYQAIDLALFHHGRGDIETARVLLRHGAENDLAIAAALGELDQVRAMLDAQPSRIQHARPFGRRPLSAAVQFGHLDIVRLLLERGADPNWPEGAEAPRGVALHAAARRGDHAMAELLLAHGADPNGSIDSSGSATWAAKTPELRALLVARGGSLDAFDLVWLGEDEEVVRRAKLDPRSADSGCGGAIAAACKLGKRDLLGRLLDAGARVPATLTACRSYLLADPEMLRMLLASGMDPDLPNWQHATPLHDLCARDSRGRPNPNRESCAAILLDAGASAVVRDEAYRSTPLAWAARCDLPDMVDLLLARGAPTSLPDDESWATPLAWAVRRGHAAIVERLQQAGARR